MPEVTNAPPNEQSAPSVEVYAVYGVEPEIQAYAMAKYSRSALSMKESLKEISQQKAEKFLNTFYFQYGHRSIADLAHVALAIERLSILAAIAVADEQRWDGQERSTRYQDFKKGGYFTPDFGEDRQAHDLYRDTIENLFREYESLSDRTFHYLVEITPKPAEMKQEAYERTLKARAFDISRYLLPLATITSLGTNRQRPHARNSSFAPAFTQPQRSSKSGRAAEAGRSFSRIQRQPRLVARTGGSDPDRFSGSRRTRRAGVAARSTHGSHSGQVCGSEPIRD